jgi:hypothetical protein
MHRKGYRTLIFAITMLGISAAVLQILPLGVPWLLYASTRMINSKHDIDSTTSSRGEGQRTEAQPHSEAHGRGTATKGRMQTRVAAAR